MKLIGMWRFMALPLGATLFLLSTPASANLLGKDKGLYIGASVGAASTEFEENGVDIDDSDLAYKLFGGWQFNGLFAIEGGVNYFGEPGEDNVDAELTGISLFGVFGIPIGPVRAFVKGGGVAWDADVDGADDDDGVDLAGGVGVDFELFSIGWRVEYERFEAAESIDQASIGITFTF